MEHSSPKKRTADKIDLTLGHEEEVMPVHLEMEHHASQDINQVNDEFDPPDNRSSDQNRNTPELRRSTTPILRLKSRVDPAQSSKLTAPSQPETLNCPICGKSIVTDNAGLNQHIDFCLSKSAIMEATRPSTPKASKSTARAQSVKRTKLS